MGKPGFGLSYHAFDAMRKNVRPAVLITVLAGLLGLVVYDSVIEQHGSQSSSTPATTAGASTPRGDTGGADRRSVRLELPERTPIGESRAGLFSSRSWQSPATERAISPKSARVAVAPAPPPMPYRFAGALVQDGKLQVLLATGSTVVPVREGETIDGGYRVDSIGDDQITLTYLPLKKKEVIPFFSSLLPGMKRDALARGESDRIAATSAGSRVTANAGAAVPKGTARANMGSKAKADKKPAQLLWRGPKQVQLGQQFSVSLRVTSSQPVGASPMRIDVNPKLLETVAVKPGRFFGPGKRNFGYRVNPDGSIFVAAMSRNPAPVADAEFVVLTFIPRQATPEAKLTIASLNLQDPAGRPIEFGQPEAFRTAIGP